jgi:hypothetical protein
MTICESYVDLIARLRQETDGLRQTIMKLKGETEWLRSRLSEAHQGEAYRLTFGTGQHDLPVSHLPQTLEDEREGY